MKEAFQGQQAAKRKARRRKKADKSDQQLIKTDQDGQSTGGRANGGDSSHDDDGYCHWTTSLPRHEAERFSNPTCCGGSSQQRERSTSVNTNWNNDSVYGR